MKDRKDWGPADYAEEGKMYGLLIVVALVLIIGIIEKCL